MRRFYASVENFDEKVILLDPEQSRHLRNVLRLSEGENVRVFDGTGREFLCAVEGVEKHRTILQIIEKVLPASPESDLELVLAVALLKGEKFDLVISKAVELGVTGLLPIMTKRCDVKMKESAKKLARWEKIIIESSKQTGRARLMEIAEPCGFESFLENYLSGHSGGKLLFAEKGGENFAQIKPAKKITAVIGPEGGWELSEIESAAENGFQIITLTGRILRAETAAITVAALLQHNFGDLI